jgi:hypothetical protein
MVSAGGIPISELPVQQFRRAYPYPRRLQEDRECRIWTPPRFASTPLFGDEVRLLTYIRPLIAASVYRSRAMMGYPRTSSQSLCRAFRTSTFSGSASAGSTCSPSFGLLCNRGGSAPLFNVINRLSELS